MTWVDVSQPFSIFTSQGVFLDNPAPKWSPTPSPQGNFNTKIILIFCLYTVRISVLYVYGGGSLVALYIKGVKIPFTYPHPENQFSPFWR